MKAAELREKSIVELETLRNSLCRAGFKLTLLKASGELTNTAQIKKNRKVLARIEGIVHHKKQSIEVTEKGEIHV